MANPIPLTAPDGTVVTYVCGVCWNVASVGHHMGAEKPAAEEFAESAREAHGYADSCCRCRLCNKITARPVDLQRCCRDCQPRAEREEAERRDKWTERRLQDAADRNETLKGAVDIEDANALEQAMCDISEDCYCAGWLNSLEFDLWTFCLNGPGDYGMGKVEQDDIDRLKKWSGRAGGWWQYQRFVPLAEWQQIYAAHVAALTEST